MVVPSGFVPLLEAVERVAADIDPEAMKVAKPAYLEMWEKRPRVSRLPPPITPIGSRQHMIEPPTPAPAMPAYDNLAPDKREAVDRLVAAARDAAATSADMPRKAAEWAEIEKRQESARETARAKLLQGLADGALSAEGIAADGDMFSIPLNPWRASYAFSALLTGSVSFVRKGAFAKVTASAVLRRADFEAWWALNLPPRTASPEPSYGKSYALPQVGLLPIPQRLPAARMWMKLNVTVGSRWKRDGALTACRDVTKCDYRTTLNAWNELPSELKRSRGAPKLAGGKSDK